MKIDRAKSLTDDSRSTCANDGKARAVAQKQQAFARELVDHRKHPEPAPIE
jgi:hypothetical protein